MLQILLFFLYVLQSSPKARLLSDKQSYLNAIVIDTYFKNRNVAVSLFEIPIDKTHQLVN